MGCRSVAPARHPVHAVRLAAEGAVSLSRSRRLVRARDIAPAGATSHARQFQLQRKLVNATVELRRSEANDVLAMELLRDAREGRGQLARLLQLEISAAGLVGDLLEPPVGPAPNHPDAV